MQFVLVLSPSFCVRSTERLSNANRDWSLWYETGFLQPTPFKRLHVGASLSKSPAYGRNFLNYISWNTMETGETNLLSGIWFLSFFTRLLLKRQTIKVLRAKEYLGIISSRPTLVTLNFESSQCCRPGPSSDWGLSEVEIRTDLLRRQNLWSTHANLTGVQFHTRMYRENTFLSELTKDMKKTQNCCKSFAAKQ